MASSTKCELDSKQIYLDFHDDSDTSCESSQDLYIDNVTYTRYAWHSLPRQR
jgi:hypothetical protein